ncbi:hypothetical protein BDV27DRAFT_56086 [Aspergillus caelatus]|uniref:Uncharacterized protein n=2 Tax=Aspergillus subgen. Circumdati TaxID=2720871 RepID=A0A5N6ZNV4_9EURO|nr:uncharacterized protein BDV27DRAFT_56086 [Aspergillus caelatus]KAE8359302.1 hypothetical protein BDV27DRAFT_56086 [Aspergillus caelatus]KAE8411139.1 hypothetical protein BDV36DRAFT_98231 [Aspergillus pseudocaelatus]
MSTAVAPATAAPLTSSHMNRDPSPKNCPTLAPTAGSHSTSSPPRPSGPSRDGSSSKSSPAGRKQTSPASQNGSAAPKVIVKKEPPSSPAMQSHSRPRPRKLDLSTSLPTSGGLSARPPGGPMTAREGVNMHQVGIACLSPGFQTHDPIMREQLQRSLSVRDQQRSIIESRLQRSAKDDGPDGIKPSESSFGLPKASASKRRPPPGLSIVPPSAAQFANERVIQSAPLNQTFTSRHQPQPLTRQVANQSPTLGSTSHLHHIPVTQTNNRLPPLSDVFGSDALGSREQNSNRAPFYQNASNPNSSQSNNLPPLPSPRIPGTATQVPKRPREYRSAEEAVQELSGGREDLLPRIVHYGGHQPPTPPSPRAVNGQPKSAAVHPEAAPVPNAQVPPSQPMYPSERTARRRTRSEYEQDNGSPPLGHGPELQYRPNPALAPGTGASYGPFGAGRDSPESQRRKKEEFLALCARAWDLFHS